MKTFTTTLDADGILTVWLDLTARPVNTMTSGMQADLGALVDQLEPAPPTAVIFASAKPRTFLAGADLAEIRDMPREALDHYLAAGQRLYGRIEGLGVPTLAAINGHCLGGGLELALACTCRIAADDLKLTIGMPEVQVGLIPGWGGTVRLPRLIGLAEALPLLLGGKPVSPQTALQLGIVDRLAPREELAGEARRMLQSVPRPARRVSVVDDAGAVKRLLDDAEHEVRQRGGEELPAPLRLIEVLRAGYAEGPQAGLDAERQGLCDLRDSEAGRRAIEAFFLRSVKPGK